MTFAPTEHRPYLTERDRERLDEAVALLSDVIEAHPLELTEPTRTAFIVAAGDIESIRRRMEGGW